MTLFFSNAETFFKPSESPTERNYILQWALVPGHTTISLSSLRIREASTSLLVLALKYLKKINILLEKGL